MSVRRRPIPVWIVAFVYIAVGIVGFTYHFPELWAGRQGSVWVELTELLAVVAGAFLLHGHNWARWLAVVWIGFHVVLSAFHSYTQMAARCDLRFDRMGAVCAGVSAIFPARRGRSGVAG